MFFKEQISGKKANNTTNYKKMVKSYTKVKMCPRNEGRKKGESYASDLRGC